MFGSILHAFGELDPKMKSFILINGSLTLPLILWYSIWILFPRFLVMETLLFFGIALCIFLVYLQPSLRQFHLDEVHQYFTYDKSASGIFRGWHRPTTLEEIQKIVKEVHQFNTNTANAKLPKRKVKVVGSTHSWSSIGLGDENTEVISLELFNKVLRKHDSQKTVTVQAGCKISDLNTYLWENGLSLPTLGQISEQTVAGAMQTGTHGSSLKYGCIASQVVFLKYITATGEKETCSADKNKKVFDALRVGLGSLAIIYEVTLKCENAFALHKVEESHALLENGEINDEFLHELLHKCPHQNDYFQFSWMPHIDVIRTVKCNRTKEAPKQRTLLVRTMSMLKHLFLLKLFEMGLELTAYFEGFTPLINMHIAKKRPAINRVLPSHEALSFPTFMANNLPKYSELEYFIPIENAETAFKEIRAMIIDKKFYVNFSASIRFTAKDDIWMSPFFGRQTCGIALAMYNKEDQWTQFYQCVDELMQKYQGRPHWGKHHALKASQLASVCPNMSAFLELRSKMDPSGNFLNNHLEQTLITPSK